MKDFHQFTMENVFLSRQKNVHLDCPKIQTLVYYQIPSLFRHLMKNR